jgi:hypothetical protein
MQRLLKPLHHLPTGSKLRIQGKPGPWRYLGDGYICKYTYPEGVSYKDEETFPRWDEVLPLAKKLKGMSPFSRHPDLTESIRLYWGHPKAVDIYREYDRLCNLLCRDDTIRVQRIKGTDTGWYITRIDWTECYLPLTKIWIIT